MCLIALALAPFFSSSLEAIERRRTQFPKETSYLILPFPFNLPGIGSGILFTGLAGNIGGSNVDAFAVVATGDAEAFFASGQDIHIIEETLILSAQFRDVNKLVLNNYQSRGMESDPDDFTLLEINQFDGQEIGLCLCLLDLRLQFSAGISMSKSRIERIRDSDGELIAEFDNAIAQENTTTTLGLVIDYTDDWRDPRKGFRLEASRAGTPPDDEDDPDFSVVDVSLSVYIPVGAVSTVVVNYFQSDADVARKGQTGEAALREEFGLSCDSGDQACLDAEQQIIDRFTAERTFGTATSLGGAFGRLRAYPQNRFRGAHTVFYAVEFRWNLTEEATPFDYFIWKDIRTAMQIAFFAETGSVADLRSEVGDTFKSSYGVGFRLISGSGFVYRLDLATGDEGTNPILIFGYPF